MIPLRLTLHNFMCYREHVPPLELDAVHLACLSGDNGAGKSALLDAITWSLWGKARVNADLDLMSLGATEMQVEFEFRLAEQTYRVARRRTRRGAAAGWLDLFVRDISAESWRSLTGDGVRQTQARIIDLLKMDYETFINSAFLVQGRADEFTTKPPAQRKEVLGEILGLAEYDRLERRARESARERQEALRQLEAECSRLEGLAARESEHQAEIDRLTGVVLEANQERARLELARQGLREQLAQVEQQARRLADVAAELTTLATQRGEHLIWVDRYQQEIALYEQVLSRREAIEAGADRLLALQAALAVLDGHVRTLRALEGQRHTLERVVAQAQSALQTEQRSLTSELVKLGEVAAQRPHLAVEHADLVQKATAATRLVEEIAAHQAEERRLHGEIEALKAHNDALKAEMHRLRARQRQIDDADALCPLCRRPLTGGDKQHIHNDYQQEGERHKVLYREHESRMADLTAAGEALRTRLTTLGAELQRAQKAIREEARLGQLLAAATTAEHDQSVLQIRLADLAGRLNRREFAVNEQADLARLAGEIATLGYDEGAHDQLRAEIDAHAAFAEQRREVRRAAEQVPGLREQLAGQLLVIERLDEAVSRLEGERQALAASLQARSLLQEQLQALNASYEQWQRLYDETQRDLGRTQAELVACQTAAELLRERRREREQAAEQRELFGELVEAFGKKGIQAMIIETVVPELQDEANALLDRMPGNTMRVEFQTQRDSRAGDTIETLEVIIKDEIGARRYELYSGGEAFRANFAIRVALSKLLARRAGARLELLIIDEGFGTQDARGRDGLVEAIRAIEQDFATILVITHLTDIKDEFPTRIDVIKGLDGSTVAVNAGVGG